MQTGCAMHQITFSDQSVNEFNKMEKLSQLQFISNLSAICDAWLQEENPEVKNFKRDGKNIYRCKVDGLRVYFEIRDNETIFCNYILHQYTLTDFIYRMKLPVTEEQMLEQYDSFWKYLESLYKTPK